MTNNTDPFGHRTVSESAISTFGWLTGDYSRIHYDYHFAAETDVGKIFAHGLLGASWSLGMLTRFAPATLKIGERDFCIASFEINFAHVVAVGDTLSLALIDTGSHSTSPAFLLRNQDGATTTHGVADVVGCEQLLSTVPALWPGRELAEPTIDPDKTYFATDMMTQGPRGELPVRTITESDVVNFASFSGDLNPLYIDAEFAAKTVFGQRIAPPMLVFCLSFASWLRGLLMYKMPSQGSAGHLRDKWQFYRPVAIGDTIAVRHRPLSFRQSKSRPDQALVSFGLQMVNQRGELVQSGEMLFMMPMPE